jgi:hypothetical protein
MSRTATLFSSAHGEYSGLNRLPYQKFTAGEKIPEWKPVRQAEVPKDRHTPHGFLVAIPCACRNSAKINVGCGKSDEQDQSR